MIESCRFLKYRIRTMTRIKKAQVPRAKGKSAVSPCISTLPRHRMVELLWSFTPAYQRWSESLLVEKGLSPQRLRILGSIHERGPRIMSDLKNELGVTATNVTALVDSLEKDGLVVRTRHPTDRRATVIELSDKVMTELSPRCTEYKEQVAELFSDLSDNECKAFVKTLEKLWSRLQG
ncbi:MAG: Putative Transcriptional regulator, MarR family [Nitrospira sp.]|nr:MAG: Putative Transcriptional regulator, MarR family [Nitrospira sp.]